MFYDLYKNKNLTILSKFKNNIGWWSGLKFPEYHLKYMDNIIYILDEYLINLPTYKPRKLIK